jgi:hypothetical protein
MSIQHAEHGHAACTYCTVMQHGEAAWKCSIDMLDMHHEYAARTGSMHGKAAWKCSVDM